jgi:hypothetical protein
MATSTSAMSTSAGLNASGYNLFQFFVVVNIVYMFAYSVRSHMFMNIVTSLLLLSFFWIKLLINLAKFPTIQKCDRPLLTIYIRVKVRLDFQADKSSVVVKGPFFPRVMNPRYWICGTNVWCKSWSIKAEKLRSSRGETYASNLKEHHKNKSNLLNTGGRKR